MRWWMILAVLLVGCGSHRVRCDMHLEPINAPAPNSSGVTVTESVP